MSASDDAPRTYNVFTGSAHVLVQAGEIHGDVHVHPRPEYVRASRSQLRATVPDFTNRVRELAELRALVEGGTGVVCVWGPGGVGKSTLVLHLGHEVRSRFDHAHLYADLRGVEPRPVGPAEVLGRFLLVLGVPARDVPSDPEARADLFRARLWDRPALVVLDNAHDERQVRPLLPGTATSRVLVTSRRPLSGLAGAEFVGLGMFDPASARELLRRTGKTAEVEPLADLARLCGYLPLALRIVGVKLRLTRLDAVVSELADERGRLGGLRAGDVDVRASLALSYSGLAAPVDRHFRLLGLAPGRDFGPAAAGAALGVDEDVAERSLRELVDHQLLEDSGSGRYRFHDLVRLFARDMAESTDPAADRRAVLVRGADWYRERAQAWRESALYEDCPSPEGLEWFDEEAANVLDALEAVHRAEAWRQCHQLARAVRDFFRYRGLTEEVEHVLRRAVDAARRDGDRDAELAAIVHLAMVLWENGRAAETPDRYGRALELAVDDEQRSWVLTHFGLALLRLDRPVDAIEKMREALRATTSPVGESWVSTHLGTAHRGAGDVVEAVRLYHHALALNEAAGDDLGTGWVLVHLADALADLGRWDEAEAALARSLDLGRALDDLNRQAWVLEHLGDLHARREDWDRAVEVAGLLDAVAREMHNENWAHVAAELAARRPTGGQA
ncbi:ATP-binding protein [Umezawaea sp.]|uniref:ATP-binding protein n=1 Tax=Umezawaea sp. TaxID=1955258 RepID=UPI002ED2529D